jgi:hypothetical protein
LKTDYLRKSILVVSAAIMLVKATATIQATPIHINVDYVASQKKEIILSLTNDSSVALPVWLPRDHIGFSIQVFKGETELFSIPPRNNSTFHIPSGGYLGPGKSIEKRFQQLQLKQLEVGQYRINAHWGGMKGNLRNERPNISLTGLKLEVAEDGSWAVSADLQTKIDQLDHEEYLKQIPIEDVTQLDARLLHEQTLLRTKISNSGTVSMGATSAQNDSISPDKSIFVVQDQHYESDAVNAKIDRISERNNLLKWLGIVGLAVFAVLFIFRLKNRP